MFWLAMFVSSNICLANYASFDKIESSYLYDFGDQESDHEENKNEETEDHKIGNEMMSLFVWSRSCFHNIYSLATFTPLEHFEIVTPPPENRLFDRA